MSGATDEIFSSPIGTHLAKSPSDGLSSRNIVNNALSARVMRKGGPYMGSMGSIGSNPGELESIQEQEDLFGAAARDREALGVAGFEQAMSDVR